MLLPEVEIQELDALARCVHQAFMEKQEEEELLQVGHFRSHMVAQRVYRKPVSFHKTACLWVVLRNVVITSAR